MTLLTLERLYVLAGLILGVIAVRIAADPRHGRRVGSALFWGLLGVIFVAGRAIPPVVTGYILLALVALAALGRVGTPSETTTSREERLVHAQRLGNRVFWPALMIPGTAVAGTLVLSRLHWGGVRLILPGNAAVVSVGLGAVVALILAMRITRAPSRAAAAEGSRLVQTVGWALILPQLLAALGGLFARAGVGETVAGIVAQVLPTQYPAVAVAAYCLGMALFTVCLGNAFAAFPVVTLGVGLPLIVHGHGGNPAIMAALGMLCGYCGTLLTPMAANFNVVPAMLLELDDRNAVIRAQAPIALAVLAVNALLMYACVYRF